MVGSRKLIGWDEFFCHKSFCNIFEDLQITIRVFKHALWGQMMSDFTSNFSCGDRS